MIETTELVEYLHAHWFWATHKLMEKMCWETGAYVHEPTPAHLETLRAKRELKFQAYDVSSSAMPRCAKDCVVNCSCHPWYGIVLRESGTKIDTNASPLPITPWSPCVDCYHLACINARYQGGSVWSKDPTLGFHYKSAHVRRVWTSPNGAGYGARMTDTIFAN